MSSSDKLNWYYCVGHIPSCGDEQMVECKFQGYLEQSYRPCSRNGRTCNGFAELEMRCPDCGAALVKVKEVCHIDSSKKDKDDTTTDVVMLNSDESSSCSSSVMNDGDDRLEPENDGEESCRRPMKRQKIVRWKNGVIGVAIGTYTPILATGPNHKKRQRCDD